MSKFGEQQRSQTFILQRQETQHPNSGGNRTSAQNLMNQANTETAPVEAQAGQNAQSSFNNANQTLTGAGNTIQNTALPTLQGAGSADQSMANTGGFTPAQASNYVQQQTSAATAAGNVASQQAQLAAAKTGQGNPQAALSRIARQAGQNAAQATGNAEMNLNQQENANKLQGAGQLANVGTGETSAGNAQTSIGSTQANMSNQSAQQQLAAMGLQFNSEQEAQQALDQISASNPSLLQSIEGIGNMGAGVISALYGGKGIPALTQGS
jgi:hypothetical protein